MERELREDEERRVVAELHRLILESSNKHEYDLSVGSGLIYALGRSNPWVAVQKILDILVNHRVSLSIGDVHHVCTHCRDVLIFQRIILGTRKSSPP
jgi:hypothetical protein